MNKLWSDEAKPKLKYREKKSHAYNKDMSAAIPIYEANQNTITSNASNWYMKTCCHPYTTTRQ
jgi:hypothetical protein